LHKGKQAAPVRERIVRDIGSHHELMVLGNAEYKAEVVNVFDRSFALMRSMELIAIIVALLGIVNTLVVAVIDRTVELGILKAIGGVRQQVRRMFMVEALLIGLAAGVLGLMGGVVFSLYTVKELLRFQMGWNIAWHGSPLTALETILVAQVVAFIGAWLPMRSAAKLNVVEALQYE
jgi:putative ABC transport system permease protein